MGHSSAELAQPHWSETSTTAGLILLCVVAGGVAIQGAVIHPVRDYLLDFRAYYAAGQALHQGVDPYDRDAVERTVAQSSALRDHGTQKIVRYLYPPPTLGLMYVLAWLPYPAGQVPWCLFQFLLGLAALATLARAIRYPLYSPMGVLVGVGFLLSTAVNELFRWGQFDMIVLALLAAGFLALERGWLAAAGTSVGLAAVAKVTPVVYLGVLLLRREFKALMAASVCIAVLMGTAYAALGGEICRHWLINLTGVGGELPTLVSPHNMSLRGYVYRACVSQTAGEEPSTAWLDLEPTAANVIAWGLAALMAAITIAWMHRHQSALSAADCVAATIPLVLLASAVTWTHHGVQLLVPLAVMTAVVLRGPRVGVIDGGWLVLTWVMYTNWPVERFALELPAWLRHLSGPTMTYALGLTWLFMVVRYVRLKGALQAV